MTIEEQALIEWYEHQYKARKEELINNINSESWWEMGNPEEYIGQMSARLAAIKGMIHGLKEISTLTSR